MENENLTPPVAENGQAGAGSTPNGAESGNANSQTLTGSYKQEPKPEPTKDDIPEKPEQKSNPNLRYPDGFDENTFDLATGKPKMENILEMVKQAKDGEENYKKQAQDLRRIVSKGQAKEKVEDYMEGYVPDETFKSFYNFDDEKNAVFKDGLSEIANLSVQAGLNQEQFTAVANTFNNVLAKNGIIDTRTPEQIQVQNADWLKAEKAKLDPNPQIAEKIIKNTVDIFNHSMFSEAEKKAVLDHLDTSAEFISAMNKVGRFINRPKGDLPTTEVVSTGRPSLEALEREFRDKSTTPERKIEIAKMKAQIKHG